MSSSDYKKVRKEAQRQGWTITKTANGEFLRSPVSNVDVLAHMTPSDRRAWANFLAEMRRQGFIDPFKPPKKKAPAEAEAPGAKADEKASDTPTEPEPKE